MANYKSVLFLFLIVQLCRVSGYTVGKCSVGNCRFTAPFEETFRNTRLVRYADYNGNPATADWTDESGYGPYVTVGGGNSKYRANTDSGAILSTTRYLHYGTVTIRVKVARDNAGGPAQGIVTAFTFLSDTGDEIDLEAIGKDRDHVISNYFWNREPIYDVNSRVHDNNFFDFSTWKIEWLPNRIRWFVNGKLVRTLLKSSTWDGSKYKFPSTPSRIQIGAWWHAGGWAGTFDWSKAPHVAEIDWVYVDPR